VIRIDYFIERMKVVVFALIATASALSGEGTATFYGDSKDEHNSPFDETMLGACGPKRHNAPHNVENYFVALNSIQFDSETPNDNTYSNPLCATCLLVTHATLHTQTTVYLTDSCVGKDGSCKEGDIDLSLDAFSDLVGSHDEAYHVGVAQVSWETVPCPESLPVHSEVKEATKSSSNHAVSDISEVKAVTQGKGYAKDYSYDKNTYGYTPSTSNGTKSAAKDKCAPKTAVPEYAEESESYSQPLDSSVEATSGFVVLTASILLVASPFALLL
jgi:hypothetical protein